jgi:hypothetical protein
MFHKVAACPFVISLILFQMSGKIFQIEGGVLACIIFYFYGQFRVFRFIDISAIGRFVAFIAVGF